MATNSQYIIDKGAKFGDVANVEVQLNEVGQVVQGCWDKIPAHFPQVEFDQFVVMPNHIHGIVCIHDHVGAHGMRPGDLHTNNRASIGAPAHADHPIVAF